jgi:CubicO group peptidase (beta-lactamase class C family)
MSHPRFALAIVLILLLQIVVPAQQAAIALDKNDPELRAILTEIEADAEKARVKAKIPGMSIVIVHDQDVLLVKGFGYADLEKKIPADPQTVYRTGSVTKAFTALMLMQLRDAGKLQLDDPIEKYLPEFKIKSRFPDARPATFRQVAAHYSGLPREAPMPYEYQNTDEQPSVEEQLKSLKDVEMPLPAMTMYSYSNLGYAIMGLALSRVAKQPYDQYVAAQIFKPLGMDLSGFALSEQMKKHFAVGYKPAGSDGTYERAAYPTSVPQASGMLYSNADDMASFLSLFFREGPRGGKQVLGSSSLLEMLTPVAVSTDIGRNEQGRATSLWAYGSTVGFSVNPFRADGEQVHYKGGLISGFTSNVYINYPRKLALAFLTNTELAESVQFDLGYNLLRKLTPVVVKSLERSRAKALEEALPTWQKYTGKYVITDPNAIPTLTFSEFDVSIVNKKLVITIPEVRPGSAVWLKEVPLVSYGNNDFKIDGGSFGNKFITFESGNDGSMRLKWRNYTFNKRR